jgi:predicted  nucleic acid-binding Zn-ribbon protein
LGRPLTGRCCGLGCAEVEAQDELDRLTDKRSELATALDALEDEQRAAHEAVRAAQARVADIERRRVAGEAVAEAEQAQAAKALARSRQTADAPWAEKRAGRAAAVRDADRRIQLFIGEHYPSLQDGLRAEGEAVAVAVNRAAERLVEAHREWEAILSRMTELAASVRPVRPGDWTRARSEAAVRAAAALLDQGGEVGPDCRDPRTPRHREAVAEPEPVA